MLYETYQCDTVDQSDTCHTVSDLSSHEAAKKCLPNEITETVDESVRNLLKLTVKSSSPFLEYTIDKR